MKDSPHPLICKNHKKDGNFVCVYVCVMSDDDEEEDNQGVIVF